MFKCDICGHQQFKGGHNVICKGCHQPYEFAGADGYRIALSPGQVMALRCAPMLPADWIKERVSEPISKNILTLEGVLLLLGRGDMSGPGREKAVNIGKELIAQIRKVIERLDDKVSDDATESQTTDILDGYPCLSCAHDPTDPQRNICFARKEGHCPH